MNAGTGGNRIFSVNVGTTVALNEAPDSYAIRSVGLTRRVPAGTFHDVIEVVRTAAAATLVNGTEYRETYFYAPNVGPIEAIVPVMMPTVEGRPSEVRRFHLTLRGYTIDGQM